jgi:hypothetical protein
MPMGALAPGEIYRERAKECFRLAEATRDSWTKDALQRFGCDMLEVAQELETTTLEKHPYYTSA